MPYERPGAGVYVQATKTTPHDSPSTENGHVGVAIKQDAESWTAGYTAVKTITIGKRFHLRTKGEKQVRINPAAPYPIYDLQAATFGAPVWIVTTDNTLTLTGPSSGTKLPYGRVSGLPGDQQGCPSGWIRIDLDQKDTIPTT